MDVYEGYSVLMDALRRGLKRRKNTRKGASPSERGATDFGDREGHRAPFASRDTQAGYAQCIRTEATLETL